MKRLFVSPSRPYLTTSKSDDTPEHHRIYHTNELIYLEYFWIDSDGHQHPFTFNSINDEMIFCRLICEGMTVEEALLALEL